MSGKDNKPNTRRDTRTTSKSDATASQRFENGAAARGGGTPEELTNTLNITTAGMCDQQFNELKRLLTNVDTKIERNGDRIGRLEADLKKNHEDLKKELNSKINGLSGRVSKLEGSVGCLTQTIDAIKKPEFDSDCTIIISNLSSGDAETDDALMKKVDHVIGVGLELPGIEPVAIRRLNGRNNNPGLVKVELADLQTKKYVLSAKIKLNSRAEFKNLYIRRYIMGRYISEFFK